jgi:transcriptional regulator with XRE-family HTH domain
MVVITNNAGYSMQVHEKLKIMRLFKDWTQEEMAEKLGYSLNGYTRIERGETDITIGKLEKIAQTLGIDVEKLIGLNEKNIFYIAEHCHYTYASQNGILLTEAQCTQELEKMSIQLIAQEKEIALQQREIENLKTQIIQLQEINALLKK